MMPTVTGNYGFFSGTDEERARDINALFHDDDVKAIICLNGGYQRASSISWITILFPLIPNWSSASVM